MRLAFETDVSETKCKSGLIKNSIDFRCYFTGRLASTPSVDGESIKVAHRCPGEKVISD